MDNKSKHFATVVVLVTGLLSAELVFCGQPIAVSFEMLVA